MIERLLAAERALEAGQLEVAERLYAQVEAADPRNAIAMTGRAKVARAQGELDAARRHVTRALETDPDDPAAQELLAALRKPVAPASVGPRPTVSAASAPSSSPGLPVAPAPSRGASASPAARPSILRSIERFLRSLVGR